MFTKITDLCDYIDTHDFKIIVVEGYEGVGKSHLLRELATKYGEPYRPDYGFWQEYGLPKIDRWRITGYFFDVLNHFNPKVNRILLFDRGMVSGIVYNEDMHLIEAYQHITKNLSILHVLVSTDFESYKQFQLLRNPDTSLASILTEWSRYLDYTARYTYVLQRAEVDYVLFNNKYDEGIAEISATTCQGCGHYSYGYCMNPYIAKPVDPMSVRCEHTKEMEVQDTSD